MMRRSFGVYRIADGQILIFDADSDNHRFAGSDGIVFDYILYQ